MTVEQHLLLCLGDTAAKLNSAVAFIEPQLGCGIEAQLGCGIEAQLGCGVEAHGSRFGHTLCVTAVLETFSGANGFDCCLVETLLMFPGAQQAKSESLRHSPLASTSPDSAAYTHASLPELPMAPGLGRNTDSPPAPFWPTTTNVSLVTGAGNAVMPPSIAAR